MAQENDSKKEQTLLKKSTKQVKKECRQRKLSAQGGKLECIRRILLDESKNEVQNNSNQEHETQDNHSWQCDSCGFSNESKCRKCNATKIDFIVRGWNSCVISIAYSSSVTIQYIFDKIIKILNCQLQIEGVDEDSFLGISAREWNKDDWDNLKQNVLPKSITEYNKDDIINKGLSLCFKSLPNENKLMPELMNELWECDTCKHQNKNICMKCKSVTLTFPLRVFGGDSYVMSSTYYASITIQSILNKAADVVNANKYPKIHRAIPGWDELNGRPSFLEIQIYSWDWEKEKHKVIRRSIVEFDKSDIINKGFSVQVEISFTHKVDENVIRCKSIRSYNQHDEKKQNDELNPIEMALKCPIYSCMKIKSEATENGLNHLYEYSHFKTEYKSKPICKKQQECKAFLRLSAGGNSLEDRCHVKIYRHPPRAEKQTHSAKTFHKLVTSSFDQVDFGYFHDGSLPESEVFTSWDGIYVHPGFVDVLVNEVIENGYKFDLCLECSKRDDCKHDNDSLGLIKIAKNKLNDIRHKQMDSPLKQGQMLALLLYTGGECNY
eukprot:234478_1